MQRYQPPLLTLQFKIKLDLAVTVDMLIAQCLVALVQPAVGSISLQTPQTATHPFKEAKRGEGLIDERQG
jgi:hypothetical protein